MNTHSNLNRKLQHVVNLAFLFIGATLLAGLGAVSMFLEKRNEK